MKFLGLEISKKVLIGIIASVVVVGGATTGVILLNNNDKKQEQETSIVLKENLNIEVNSELKLLSLIEENKDIEIISDDEIVDTSTLGEKELTIKYLDKKKKEKEQIFKIVIVDTQAPTIEYQKELTTTAGTEIDLLKDVKVSDNSNEEIKATIDGTYDFNNEGTYNLKYVAVDSSNNKKEEEFTLKVNAKPVPVCEKKTGSITTTKPSMACQYTTKIISWEWTEDLEKQQWVWALNNGYGLVDPEDQTKVTYNEYKPYLFTKPSKTYSDNQAHNIDVTVYIIK